MRRGFTAGGIVERELSKICKRLTILMKGSDYEN